MVPLVAVIWAPFPCEHGSRRRGGTWNHRDSLSTLRRCVWGSTAHLCSARETRLVSSTGDSLESIPTSTSSSLPMGNVVEFVFTLLCQQFLSVLKHEAFAMALHRFMHDFCLWSENWHLLCRNYTSHYSIVAQSSGLYKRAKQKFDLKQTAKNGGTLTAGCMTQNKK